MDNDKLELVRLAAATAVQLIYFRSTELVSALRRHFRVNMSLSRDWRRSTTTRRKARVALYLDVEHVKGHPTA
uniref:Uncharacterized protein n=1 Tax=Hyaloperonospora arabidopsidis (strain Emoy2) TaxID=559515 RepID=M4BU60_HYAAE